VSVYMPGRMRTGSRPDRTSMSEAEYAELMGSGKLKEPGPILP